jgi:hypothetical protein
MEFNQEAINSFKKIINDELAYSIFIYDWAIRKEVENHISVQLFESPHSMTLTLLKLLKFYIESSKTKSIIGFTEGDPALTSIAYWASTKTNLPYYSFNLDDEGAFSQFIRPEVCPCSLIIPYATNEIQVNEIIKLFTDKMVPITQVISLVEEHPIKTDSIDIGIEYLSIANWHSIQERILGFKNVMPEKMAKMLSIFQ